MTFVETILIILLVYYAVKFLLKLAAPYLLRYVSKKATQKFGDAFGQKPPPTSNSGTGSVTIDKMPSSKTKIKNTVGEYVDFEEVD